MLERLADLLDPPKRDVFGILGYTPTPKQDEFHSAEEFDVLYGGAAGGGKTKALLLHGIRAADRYPGLRVGGFRRTYDELAESFFKELALIDFARELGCVWNGTERELRFRSGSLIRFRYLETIQHATRRQGGEYQLVLFDERTMIPPEAVSIVADERIRSGRNSIPVLGIRSATNPGHVGHVAVKDRYVTATDHGRHVYTDDYGRTVRFISAKVDDNPHVDAGYRKRLESIPDPTRRAAMLDGSWDVFDGQFFSEWRHERHVVAAITIPPEWRRIAGIDWGYAAPHAVIWCALDPDGRVWVYRERYAKGVGERDVARKILEAEGGSAGDRRAYRPAERVRHIADPSMWSKIGDANPIADTFGAEGVPLLKASNDRVAGWQRVHTFLAEAPACELHRKAGWATCPKLHVLEGAAPNLVRTLPGLVHDEHRVEDVDSDGEDHVPDALRYALMHIHLKHREREDAPTPTTPAERTLARIAKKKRSRPLVT